MNLEQASKVKSWMPIRQSIGEGRANREATEQAPVRSTGVVRTACWEGDLSNWGKPGAGEGVRAFNAALQELRPVWASDRLIVPWKPGNTGGGKEPDLLACF